MQDCLFIIPARAGSKGLPGKNVRLFNGEPLVARSVQFARQFTTDQNICVTTNDTEVVAALKKIDYKCTFLRSETLSSDTATSADVIKDAMARYASQYAYVVLLQPTTPFRQKEHLEQALQKIDQCDIIVGVKESKANPYYSLFEPNSHGMLVQSKNGNYTRRQDVPPAYEINGALYVYHYNIAKDFSSFAAVQKLGFVVMDEQHSIDIDTMLDWIKAEYYLQ